MSLKLLYAAGEALPFSKTGGLADVAFALPAALARAGVDVRVVTPAYRGALERLRNPRRLAQLQLRGQDFVLWEGIVEPGGYTAWLIDNPSLYLRAGTPYVDEQGREYADNAWRFGCFSELIAQLALGAPGLNWAPRVVHLNDWHTGLVPVWLRNSAARPRVMFTIHNLAYQGLFGRSAFDALGLPPELWRAEALEFYGGFSFMKAALLYSDVLTTVSPTYAKEIQTPGFGERLDGVIRGRAASLYGITNGIDIEAWNPATDPYLSARYSSETLVEGKRANKLALQKALGLEPCSGQPLLGFVGRLAEQKGADLLLGAADWLSRSRVQLALLGSGDKALESQFTSWAERAPGQVGIRIGYDEKLAHLIEGGADFFVMPSRYEPCGLNQMYSQRYGTIPVVRNTGGLADTVTDANPATLSSGRATGIVFDHADTGGVTYGLQRALDLMRQPEAWRAMQRAGLRRDFGWDSAARALLGLYSDLSELPATLK